MKINHFFFLLFLSFFSITCTPSEDEIYVGTWQLTSSSGGIHGGGFSLNYDYLVIDSDDQFEILRNDSLLLKGKIDINKDSTNNYLVIFTKTDQYSSEYFDLASDGEKYMIVANDSLNLIAPCCDRFDSYYTRK